MRFACCELLGDRIVPICVLRDAIGCLCLGEDATIRPGLATHLPMKCTQYTWFRCLPVTDSAALSSAALNARSVLGSWFCGRDIYVSGRTSMCAVLSLPPLSVSTPNNEKATLYIQ